MEGRIGGGPGPSMDPGRPLRAESPSSQGAPALPPRPRDHPPVQRQYSPPQGDARVPLGAGDMGPPPPPPPKGGNQAPPPTPPRGTTPPPPIPPHNASGAVGGVGANPSNLPMFKRMSPVPSLPCRPGQGISQYPVMPPVTRGTSPTARPVIVPNSLEAQAQVDQMRMHALSLYPSTELNGAVVEPPPPYPMGTAAHSSAPPPPSYSQSLAMRQSPTHSSTSSDYRRYISFSSPLSLSTPSHSLSHVCTFLRSPGLPLHYPSVQFTHGAASLGPSTAASPIPACPSPVSSILSGSSRYARRRNRHQLFFYLDSDPH